MTGRKPRKYPMRPMVKPAPSALLGEFWITSVVWEKDWPQGVHVELDSHGPVDAPALVKHMQTPATVRFGGPNILIIERLA